MKQFRLPLDYKKEVKNSVFNLNTVRRTTMLPGQIIPIYSRKMKAGDKFILDPSSLLKSLPLNSPLYGSYLLQMSIYFDSDTNYYGFLDNNTKLSTQELLNKSRHRYNFGFVMETIGDDETEPITPSNAEHLFNGTFNNFRGSVLEYMGVPSGIVASVSDTTGGSAPTEYDIGFVLTYLNIFRNYFANKQSNKFPYIKNGVALVPGTSLARPFDIFWDNDMSVLDDLFMDLRNSKDGIDFSILEEDGYTEESNPGLFWLLQYLTDMCKPSGGILLTTYLPDFYRNLLDDTFNNKVSRVTTSGNSFTIDSLRFANKLQRLIDRFDISGGRFSDWLKTVWGVQTRKDMDIPELIGVSQCLIDPSQVTAQSAGDDVPLGEFGGNFDKYNGHRKHSFVASTPGRVMVCLSLVPNVDYSQGLDSELVETRFADEYFPEFEQLGYQKVPGYLYQASFDCRVTEVVGSDGTKTYTGTDNLSVADGSTGYFPSKVIGKQVAWLAMMTDVNRCYGEFGNHGIYENWVMKRRYQYPIVRNISGVPNVSQVTQKVFLTRINQYINPLEYQDQFIQKGFNVPDWFVQFGLGNTAVRPKGKRFMPNLE